MLWLFPWWCWQCRKTGFHPWVGKIPWRRERLPTPGFLGFPGGSDSKESACIAGDLGSIPELGRSPGGRNGNPFQYSCLENSHGQRSRVGYSPRGRKELDTTEWLSTHWVLRFPGKDRKAGSLKLVSNLNQPRSSEFCKVHKWSHPCSAAALLLVATWRLGHHHPPSHSESAVLLNVLWTIPEKQSIILLGPVMLRKWCEHCFPTEDGISQDKGGIHAYGLAGGNGILCLVRLRGEKTVEDADTWTLKCLH